MNMIEEIKKLGKITLKMKEDYFKNMKLIEIRNWLEENGFDRHMPIEILSTEIAIMTPKGVLMQIRPNDHNQLGLWGGIIEEGEQPIECAIREIYEETQISISADKLLFVEENDHFHQYANGDKTLCHTYRFKVLLDYVPEIIIDEESKGTVLVEHTIAKHQQEFIKKILGEI